MVGRYLRTRTLRELVDPPENDRLLRAHLQARENGFGVKGKNAAEDWHRALAVLRWYWRRHHGTRSARGGEVESRSNTLLIL